MALNGFEMAVTALNCGLTCGIGFAEVQETKLGIMCCGYMFVATSSHQYFLYCPLLHRPLRQYSAVRLDSDITGELKESKAYHHHDSHDALCRHSASSLSSPSSVSSFTIALDDHVLHISHQQDAKSSLPVVPQSRYDGKGKHSPKEWRWWWWRW